MATTIHPTALIGEGARIGEGTTIGPYTVVEAGAEIGRDNAIGAQCYLFASVRLGEGNRLMRGASLGGEPQDLTYGGEPTRCRIGDRNYFGENFTAHRGTPATGETVIGDGNFLMANAHVGHDCRLGDGIVMANGALVAGRVTIDDRANIGGNAALHQFVRVGTMAMVGGLSRVRQDVLPFAMMSEDNTLFGLNWIGLRRSGLPTQGKALLKEAYRRFCVRREPLAEFQRWLVAQPEDPLLEIWRRFLAGKSRRGYARAGTSGDGEEAEEPEEA